MAREEVPCCAEEIKDEAVKCRYCASDLTQAPGAHAGTKAARPPPQSPGIEFTHSGERHMLGAGRTSSADGLAFAGIALGWIGTGFLAPMPSCARRSGERSLKRLCAGE